MLKSLGDGWFCFEGGQRWRCQAPGYLCEIEAVGNCPSLLKEPGIAERVRRIRAFYAGRIQLGVLDQYGTGLDILVANAMTESYGTVPSPLDFAALERQLDTPSGFPLDVRLDQMLREIGASKASRWLVRFEPGYTSPFTTPAKVSVGAHHMLIATAMNLASQRSSSSDKKTTARLQILQLASKSLHAAQLATEYLNNKHAAHQGQLPLIAATYNAGSPRLSTSNPWRLVQYGKHIDRWVAYYNASRLAINTSSPQSVKSEVLTAPARSTVFPGNASSLSPHFTLAELCASDTARKLGIANQPPPLVDASLRQLAGLLEQVRTLLGDRALHISSGYRCPELNQAVGSKSTSRHLHGLAADFTCSQYGSPLQICRAIAASSIPFDQIIHEYGRWVHIGLALPGQALRRQQLTIDKGGTHVGLLPVVG